MDAWNMPLRVEGEARDQKPKLVKSRRATESSRSMHSASVHQKSVSIPLKAPEQMVLVNSAKIDSGTLPSVIKRTNEQKQINPDRLNLDRHELSSCPILCNEDQLRLLNYQHNQIRVIDNLHSLRRLIFLDLYDNQITQISGLDSLHSLRVLMLGKNKIKRIEHLVSLSKLDVLDLHGNEISTIENLAHLSELRVLNLAGNRISRVCNLKGLQSLAELNLRRNNISTICEIEYLPNLQRMFLSYNAIGRYEDLACLALSLSLVELTLDSNPIADDPRYRQTVLAQTPQLRQLDMKRVMDEERRIAQLAARKDEERERLRQRHGYTQNTRRQAISNVRRQWTLENGGGSGDLADDSEFIEDRTSPIVDDATNGVASEEKTSVSSTPTTLDVEGALGESMTSQPSTPTTVDGEPDHRLAILAVRNQRERSRLNARPASGRRSSTAARAGGTTSTKRRPSSSVGTSGFGSMDEVQPSVVYDMPEDMQLARERHIGRIDLRGGGLLTNVQRPSNAPAAQRSELFDFCDNQLTLFGPASLDILDKPAATTLAGAAASCVSAVRFVCVDFDAIAETGALQRLRSRFPNVLVRWLHCGRELVFKECRLGSLGQLNTIASTFRCLDSLTVTTEGNPVTSQMLFRPYAVFRLYPLGLKSLNDTPVTSSESINAASAFSTMTSEIISQTHPQLLAVVAGDAKRQQVEAISEDRADRAAIEAVARLCLTNEPLLKDLPDHSIFAQNLVRDTTNRVCLKHARLAQLDKCLPNILDRMVREQLRRLENMDGLWEEARQTLQSYYDR